MATTVSQPGYFNLQGFTDLGALAVGGRIYTFASGTTTKKNAYTEATGTTVHTYTSDGVGGEYIALNARGELPAPLYLTSGAYDITYKTSAGATVWTRRADPTGADLAASAGSASIGFLQSGTGAVTTTVQAKLRQFVTAEDFTSLAVAIAAGYKLIELTAASYAITSTVTIPANVTIFGKGSLGTEVVIGADVVGFVLSEYSRLKGIKLTKTGSHTKNGIEVGSAVLDGGRAVIEDVFVSGMGLDGIQIIQGNLGTLRDVTSISNGLNGIRFLAGNGDCNAWVSEGYIDVRGNGNDGFRVDGGASLSDPLCSKSNFFSNIIAQQNTQYGVYIGSRSNIVTAYVEANTAGDFILGTYARGNDISTVEGTVVDNSSDPSFNVISQHNAVAGYQRIFQNRTLFSGATSAGLQIFNDDGAAGTLALSKTGARAFALTGLNSSGEFTLAIKNNAAPTAYMTTSFGGNTLPDSDNAFNLGNASFRWATVYAGTGAINTSDEREKQDIESLSAAELRAAVALKGLVKKFRFRDAVLAKGAAARIHVGVIAQEVAQAFEAEGLDPMRYGILCFDEWEASDGRPAGNRYGVRYEELLAFIISAL